MYYVTHSFDFAAAHFLRDYNGNCANLHGHNYTVDVTLKGEKLQENEILVDFSLIKQVAKGTVISNFDHKVLNEVMEDNPTAENIARIIYDTIKVQFMLSENGIIVDNVRVWETSNNSATYRED